MTGVVLLLHARRREIFIGLPASLLLGALLHEAVAVRLLVALAVSLYQLTDSSITNRHGEFPMLYCAWAMVLPGEWAHAAAFGARAFCLRRRAGAAHRRAV